MNRKKKHLEKEIRAYILVIRVINGDTWLHDLGGLDVSYIQTRPLNDLMMDTQLSIKLG